MQGSEIQYKVILIGDAGVGKSTFASRLNGTQPCSGKICTKEYTFGKERVRFYINDTAGEEAYRSVPSIFYRRADVAICMYCTEKSPLSWVHLTEWIDKVNAVAKNPIIVVVENCWSLCKEETSKTSDEDDLDAFRKHYGVKLRFRISAVSEQHVEDTFAQIARAVHTKDFGTEKKCVDDDHEVENSIMLTKCSAKTPRGKMCGGARCKH